jgi:hypothetical protein
MDEKILRQIMTQLTVSVPVAGKALGELCKNTSYAVAAKTGKIGGCPVMTVAGKRRVATTHIRRQLGPRRRRNPRDPCTPQTRTAALVTRRLGRD